MAAPKVFISYSHDSKEHAGRVLGLSDRLRQDGIDSHIDQYEVSPPEDWPRWMVNKVEWADFVLVVCTETYQQRFKGKAPTGQGKGVKWEGAILIQELYDAEGNNTKVIPAVFGAEGEAYIPAGVLRGQTYYDVSADKGYESLYRHLTNQPRVLKPKLGKLKPMPQLNPVQERETSTKEAKQKELEELQKELKSTQRPIPHLLPYMPDRTEQEEALEKAIKQLNHESPCPVVCLIHGDEYQCHDMFVQRLLDKSLPSILRDNRKVEPYCFVWPTEFKSKEQFHEKLERSLLSALRKKVKWQGSQPCDEQTASAAEEINRQFASHPAPVLVHTHLMTTDWFKHREDMLMWFLEFWQKWPSLMAGQRLFVCWVMKYEELKGLIPEDFEHPGGKCRSVVLIDEIDKAPRDFPNDMLNEIEHLYFRVPELGNVKIEADAALKPIVIITSNSEKDLPDAFLRRCIYYNIPFPKRDELQEIITNRLGLHSSDASIFIDSALELFFKLREAGLRKKPATAELLGWIVSLKAISEDQENPLNNPEFALTTLSNLIKTREDQQRAEDIVKQWIKEKQS